MIIVFLVTSSWIFGISSIDLSARALSRMPAPFPSRLFSSSSTTPDDNSFPPAFRCVASLLLKIDKGAHRRRLGKRLDQLVEIPEPITDVVQVLQGRSLLHPRHLGAAEEGPPYRYPPPLLLLPDDHQSTSLPPVVEGANPWPHHIGSVQDELDRALVHPGRWEEPEGLM